MTAAPVGAPAPANGAAPAANGAPAHQANNGAPAQQPAAAKTEAAEKAFHYKTKLRGADGREVEVEYKDPQQLARELAEGRDAKYRREREGKELSEYRQFLKQLTADPRTALQRLNINLDELALQRAEREAQLAEMSPEAREAAELKQKLADIEAAQQRAQKEAQQTKAQRRHQAMREQAKADIIASLKHVGMDISGRENATMRGAMMSLASRIQQRAIRAKQPPYTPEQLGAEVHKAWLSDAGRITKLVAASPEFRTRNAETLSGMLEGLTGGLEGPALLQFLGPAFAKRIVQAQLAALEQGRSSAAQTSPSVTQTQPPKGEAPPLDYYELQKWKSKHGLR